MSRAVRAVLTALAVAAGSGCGAVISSGPTMTNVNGDAWYTEGTGFLGMFFESRIYYCPAPTSGPAQCFEARYVEDASAAAAPAPAPSATTP